MNDQLKTSAKDFFLYLGMIAALYISAISILTVAFQAINAWFPDALLYNEGVNPRALRFAVAALFIVFPLFLVLSRAVYRDLQTFPDKSELGIRRWLIYLTLFIAGITLTANLIVLINAFLEGELTVRFTLKVAAVALVASAVFRYYLFDLHRDITATAPRVRQFAWLGAIAVVITLVGGYFIVGSPGNQRLMRFDERRVNDLSSIQWEVLNYWQAKGELPNDLSAITDPFSGQSTIAVDPETGDPYGYRVTGDLSFELCATFALSSKDSGIGSGATMRPMYPEFGGTDGWEYDAGHACFERTIDPQRYPPRNTGDGMMVPKPVIVP